MTDLWYVVFTTRALSIPRINSGCKYIHTQEGTYLVRVLELNWVRVRTRGRQRARGFFDGTGVPCRSKENLWRLVVRMAHG